MTEDIEMLIFRARQVASNYLQGGAMIIYTFECSNRTIMRFKDRENIHVSWRAKMHVAMEMT